MRADMVRMQMRAHDEIDVIHGQTSRRQSFLKTIAVQHIPERTARPLLVIADAGIDQDIVVRRFDNETLNTDHEPALGIDEFRFQPPPVLVEKLFSQILEKRQRLEERTLLL